VTLPLLNSQIVMVSILELGEAEQPDDAVTPCDTGGVRVEE
jgi:hypothetical protein